MKRRYWGLLVVSMGILLLGVCGCSGSYLNGAEVKCTGYQGKGSAYIPDAAQLKIMKRVAEKEGKSAKVDGKLLSAYIDRAKSVSDLASEDNFEQAHLTSDQIVTAQTYLEHMNKTSLEIKPGVNLSNGKKMQVVLKDNSDDPYFKPVSKEFKVSGLKTPKKVAMSSLVKTIAYHAEGYDGIGNASVSVKVPSHGRISISRIASASAPLKEFKLANGDTITVYWTELAKMLTKNYPEYRFVGVQDKSTDLTIKGLESRDETVKNLNAVDKNIIQGRELPYSLKKFSGKLKHAVIKGGESEWLTLVLLYELKDHTYCPVTIDGVTLENGVLYNEAGGKRLEKYDGMVTIGQGYDADPFTAEYENDANTRYILHES